MLSQFTYISSSCWHSGCVVGYSILLGISIWTADFNKSICSYLYCPCEWIPPMWGRSLILQLSLPTRALLTLWTAWKRLKYWKDCGLPNHTRDSFPSHSLSLAPVSGGCSHSLWWVLRGKLWTFARCSGMDRNISLSFSGLPKTFKSLKTIFKLKLNQQWPRHFKSKVLC